jgi:hypothetical protein
MFTRLVESLAATEAISKVFSDASVLQAMLDFEAALARAEARCGVIPASAVTAIAAAAMAEGFDLSELTRLSLRAGTPAIPLVKMLTVRVRAIDPEAAGLSISATSQDVRIPRSCCYCARQFPFCKRITSAPWPRSIDSPSGMPAPSCWAAHCYSRRLLLRSA